MKKFLYSFFWPFLALPIVRRILKKKKYYIFTNYPFNADGLSTKHNFDFLKDKRFKNSYNKSIKEIRTYWRAHVIAWAGENAKKLGGDFVECGVHTGGTAMMVYDYTRINKSKIKFYLVDTFTGLVKNLISKEELKEWNKNKKNPVDHYVEDVEKITRQKFKNYKNVKIIKGEIPKVLKKIKTKKISYLHIDLNCAFPEIKALEFFWGKIQKGGIIISDDYGWENHIVQKKAWDKFAKSKGTSVLSLPTGQGIIVKN